MNDLIFARSLFGTTMGFHIIFASLGVGIPLMILLAELIYQRTKDPHYAIMAKRWTKAQAVLLGVAIPTGTIAGTQLALLWPGFMEVIGKVMSLPFQIEIYAFFIEALFMSIYVYAADRLTPLMRITAVIFIVIGAAASAILITNVHAFQGTPEGFKIVNGEITDVQPWTAFFNKSFVATAGHVVVSAFMTGAFIIATIAAYKMLRNRGDDRVYALHRKALLLGLIVGGAFSLVTALSGHESAQLLHRYQPEKLAGAEGLFETQSHAPLAIGGFTDEKTQSVKWAIEIPWALSFLADNRFYAAVGFIWRKVMKKDRFPRWMLAVFITGGPLALLAIELGWVFACTGRQPWVIYHMQKTSEVVTTSGSIGILFLLFFIVYIILGAAVVFVLQYYFKRHPVEEDLKSS